MYWEAVKRGIKSIRRDIARQKKIARAIEVAEERHGGSWLYVPKYCALERGQDGAKIWERDWSTYL